MTETTPLLRVRDLSVTFPHRGHALTAVDGVSFEVSRGETLGVVGESGCGKSTMGRALMRIVTSATGSVELNGVDLTSLRGRALRETRRKMQMIFQDPISSLNPRRRIADIVAEPLDAWKSATGTERDATVEKLLREVGIDPALHGRRYPRQFSGGQCQRISIARALAMRPELLICDEVVSALDVSVQAQILNLLEDLKAEYGLTLIFIAHDLAVVKNVSDRIAVMYLGQIVEMAPAQLLYDAPAHPYTALLLGSALEADPDQSRERVVLQGEPPSPLDPPSGCRFRTRCPDATDLCAREAPVPRDVAPGHRVACHFPRRRAD